MYIQVWSHLYVQAIWGIIGSDNILAPNRRRAITRPNDGFLLNIPPVANLTEISIINE